MNEISSPLPENEDVPSQDDAISQQATAKAAELQGRLVNGANWFYWIAGLSILNYALIAFGSESGFVIGLGVSLLAAIPFHMGGEDLQGNLLLILRVVGLFVGLAAAGVFAVFGWFAGKSHIWAFVVGMALYAMDGLILALFGDWLSVGFHVFALFCIFSGFAAAREMAAIRRTVADAG